MDNSLDIGVLGAALTLVVEWFKYQFGPESMTTKFLVVTLSLIIGAIYYFFKDSSFWQMAIGVLSVSSMFYALLLKK